MFRFRGMELLRCCELGCRITIDIGLLQTQKANPGVLTCISGQSSV